MTLSTLSPPAPKSLVRERVSDAEWQLRCQLAAAHRLVAHFVFVDMTYNHISARVPGEPQHFLVKADNVFMEQVTASNLDLWFGMVEDRIEPDWHRDPAELREEVRRLLPAQQERAGLFFKRFADYPLIPGVTGFGLYDREVVDMLSSWNEPEPFLRGMVVESGYRLAVVPFDRPQRAGGRTSNDFWTLLNFALSGIGGSAKSLLRLQLVVAIFCSGFAGLLGFATLIRFLVYGYSPLMLALTFMFALFSIMLLFLGLIGDQVRLLAERMRNIPLVIEEERLNFPPGRALPSERTVNRVRLEGSQ